MNARPFLNGVRDRCKMGAYFHLFSLMHSSQLGDALSEDGMLWG